MFSREVEVKHTYTLYMKYCFKSMIRNMAIMQNFEVLSLRSDVYRKCIFIVKSSQKYNKTAVAILRDVSD